MMSRGRLVATPAKFTPGQRGTRRHWNLEGQGHEIGGGKSSKKRQR